MSVQICDLFWSCCSSDEDRGEKRESESESESVREGRNLLNDPTDDPLRFN